MEAITTQKHTLVFVQPSVQDRWEVVLEGGVKAHQFSERSLALNYAKLWASVNRPSKLRVNGTSGVLEHEWVFV